MLRTWIHPTFHERAESRTGSGVPEYVTATVKVLPSASGAAGVMVNSVPEREWVAV